MNSELNHSTRTLVQNMHLLESSYVPEDIIGRKDILDFMLPLMYRRIATNFVLYGSSGSGRYTLLLHAEKIMREHCQKIKKTFLSATIDCCTHRTSNQITSEIIRQICPDNLEFKRKKYIPNSFEYLDKLLLTTNIVFLSIFRNIDKAKDHRFIHYLSQLHEYRNWQKKYEFEKVPQIITLSTATSVSWMEHKLDESTLSLYFPFIDVLSPFSREQLHKILEYRCAAFFDDVLDKNVLIECAKEGEFMGSISRAIELLRSASIIAENCKSSRITLDHLDKAVFEKDVEFETTLWRNSSIHTKLILSSLIELSKDQVEIVTPLIYSKYLLKCKDLNIKPLSKRGFYPYIHVLESERVIDIDTIFCSNGGEIFKISMREDMKKTMEEVIQKLLYELSGKNA